MEWINIHAGLVMIQQTVLLMGVLIIISGVVMCASQYIYFIITGQLVSKGAKINGIRLNMGRILILGLEFIIAADLIGTTTTPDYYSVGLLAIIVIVRTLLSFSINKEIMSLSNKS